MIRHGLAALSAAIALILGADGAARAEVSLDDLDAAMDAHGDEMTEIRKRLNDPDPGRAMAAMRLLIEQGSPAQRQVAIEHGFTSTDPDIRLEALRAILNSKPTLVFRWVPVGDEVTNNYSWAVGQFNGDLETGNAARVPVEVGSYSDEEGCWTRADGRTCLARINAGELSLIFYDGWSQFELDSAGRLVGTPNIRGTRVDAIADLTR